MVRETDPFTPEQIRLLEQTKEKVLKMLDGVEGMSEEVRENVAVRVAQFTLGVGGISVFDKAILVYFNRDTGISGFHMVQVVHCFPPGDPDLRDPDYERKKKEQMRVQAEFNELKVLSKNYLWGQTPIIFSNKELASNFNGQSGEEYLRATTPRARFLGELVLAR